MRDPSHLFDASMTRLGIRRHAWLRGYIFSFIELFAPLLTRKAVDRAMAGGGNDFAI
ncbi:MULTISPECIES: hypothetical protein [Thiorhodovibrio]|uniref:hypothetical protein n=1 Tax=Thiorhodovibrio TaxID=61593 RepID=UPI001F5D0080|nr:MULTISPECIES: hypothetical protein [Thiorhodovibrio]